MKLEILDGRRAALGCKAHRVTTDTGLTYEIGDSVKIASIRREGRLMAEILREGAHSRKGAPAWRLFTVDGKEVARVRVGSYGALATVVSRLEF